MLHAARVSLAGQLLQHQAVAVVQVIHASAGTQLDRSCVVQLGRRMQILELRGCEWLLDIWNVPCLIAWSCI